MAFVGVETALLPETSLDDPDTVQERFLQVMALGIPGFVIRNAGSYPDAHHRIERVALPVINFGGMVRDYKFDVSSSDRDLAPHLDPHALQGQLALNEYTVTMSAVTANLFRLQPDFAQVIANTGAAYRYTYGNRPTEQDALKVEDEIVIPIAHTADLRREDYLYFTDSRHVHFFQSAMRPRLGIASIYTPSINEAVFSDQSLRMVLERAAEGNPQAYIFPEVRNALRLAA